MVQNMEKTKVLSTNDLCQIVASILGEHCHITRSNVCHSNHESPQKDGSRSDVKQILYYLKCEQDKISWDANKSGKKMCPME